MGSNFLVMYIKDNEILLHSAYEKQEKALETKVYLEGLGRVSKMLDIRLIK